jgi:mannose/fructose/sorbose-specific phosphotransferase system IIA component
MVQVYLMCHGSLAQSLYDTLGMFFGDRKGLYIFSLGEDMVGFKDEVRTAVLGSSDKELLILTDLFGGTPFNTAAALLPEAEAKGKKLEILTGVNLPMLMEIMPLLPEGTLEELKRAALETGKASIRDLKAELGK